MNRKILSRPMFQNRPHYWVAGPVIKGAKAASRIGGTRLGKKIEGGLNRVDKFDLGYDSIKGPIPIKKKGWVKESLWPTRKSGKVASGTAYGMAGYNLLKEDEDIREVKENKVITDDGNVIKKDEIINPNILDKIESAKDNVVTKITGNIKDDETEVNEGANVLSSNIFATKNEPVEKTEEKVVGDQMDMSTKFSPWLNPENAGQQAEIEKIDMKRVQAMTDQLRELIGDPGRKDNINLLMQLGSALMTGKTLRGGLAGFFDVAGQAGLQVLPQMLAVSDRRNARDQELALAAFQLIQEQSTDEAWGPGKGSMVYPHKISYKMNDDGTFFKDENNQYVAIGYTPVGSGFGFNKDYQSKAMMDANAAITAQGLPPLFTLLDAATTGAEGAFGAFGEGEIGQESKSGRDAKESYAGVLERGLPKMAEMIMFTTRLTSAGYNSDRYTGPQGLVAEKLRAILAPWEQIAAIAPWMGGTESEVGNSMAKSYAEAFDQLENYWASNMEDPNGRLVDVFEQDKLNNDGTFTDTEGIYAGQTYTYRDDEGLLRTGTTEVGDIYETPLSLRIKIGAQQSPWKEGTVGIMEQYKNQIGMIVARYKQPTGRLLADTINDSKRDVDLTPGIISNPNDIVNRQFRYFKNFLEDWKRNLEAAGVEVTPELVDKRFGAADGSGGGLALINNAIMSYNMWGLMKEADTNSVILPSYGTWVKFPGAVYPGDEAGNTLQSIMGKFKEGIQGGGIGPQEDDYYIPDDFNEEDYIDNYFESLEGIN
jgi:hypothetical protein